MHDLPTHFPLHLTASLPQSSGVNSIAKETSSMMAFRGKVEVALLGFFCCVCTISTSGDRPEVDRADSSAIRVRVTPTEVTITPEDSATVRCLARGGSTIIDMPYIYFAIMIKEDTVLPLSSSIPGISIEPGVLSSGSLTRYNAVYNTLTIGPQMYPFLKYGRNVFVCKAENMDGEIAKQQFIVNKQFEPINDK